MPYADPKNPRKNESARKAQLKRRYGLSAETYDHMVALQEGVCALCKKTETCAGKKHLTVDHCHATGKVRGLLCHRCNMIIGKIKDSPEWCDSAAAYLRRHGEGF